MRAQEEYRRIAQIEDRSDRHLEVTRLEKDMSFTLTERKDFNNIAWKGKLHVPQVQEF